MAGRQRVFVVDTTADAPGLRRLGDALGRSVLVLAPGTTDAERVVRSLGREPRTEPLLAPVRFPDADRGHALDALVRRHAMADRYRDVVVVTDQASATLLLRVLAPGQLAEGGAVTVVGLVRGDRPVSVRRALGAALVLGVAAAVSEPGLLTIPATAAALGLALLLVPPARHWGRELLLTAGAALVIALVVVASSERFPGGW